MEVSADQKHSQEGEQGDGDQTEKKGNRQRGRTSTDCAHFMSFLLDYLPQLDCQLRYHSLLLCP